MKHSLFLAAVLGAAISLTGCGGGNSTAQVVGQNPTVAIDASNGANAMGALAGQTFVYDGGISDFGTTSSTSLAVSSGSNFQLTSGGHTASGNMTFGSCHFNVTASNFTSGPMISGNTVTIASCAMLLQVLGAPLNSTASYPVKLILNGVASTALKIPMFISGSGFISINSFPIITVTLTDVTGS